MKKSRHECDRHESESLAKDLLAGNSNSFWDTLKKYSDKKRTVSNNIDNVVGENNIADHWAHIYTKYFQLNSESMKRDDLNFQEGLRNMSSDKQNLNVLSTDDVKNAI